MNRDQESAHKVRGSEKKNKVPILFSTHTSSLDGISRDCLLAGALEFAFLWPDFCDFLQVFPQTLCCFLPTMYNSIQSKATAAAAKPFNWSQFVYVLIFGKTAKLFCSLERNYSTLVDFFFFLSAHLKYNRFELSRTKIIFYVASK